MNFTSGLKDIADALGPASKVVKAASTIPILANVLISASKDGGIEVRGTDLEMTAIRKFRANVTTPGEVTVPAKVFANLVAAFSAGEDVSFDMRGLSAEVKCGGAEYKLNTISAEEYPALPTEDRRRSFVIDGASFKKCVEGAVFAASTEEARGAVLMGALVELTADSFSVAATDGYKMAVASVPIQDGPAELISVIAPARGLLEAARVVSGSEQVTITLLGGQGQHMRVEVEKGSLTVRLVDGQFPNYRAVFPAKMDRRTIVSTQALSMALRRAAMIVGDRSSKITVSIADDLLTLTGNSDTTGAAHEAVAVEHQGEPIEISFNADYLADILGHVHHEHTTLAFLGPLSPCEITPVEAVDGLKQRYLLMPLRQ